MSEEAHSTPRKWSRLAGLVDALLDLTPAQRSRRIAELSAGDPTRKAELEAIAAELEREPAFFQLGAAEHFAALLAEADDSFPDALTDRYEPRQVLGRGGMATVFLARDRKHSRDVAVKVVHPHVAAALGSDRFLREIDIVAQLRYPLIVPLYDSGKAGDRLYYVMPYEAGLSLDRKLARDGPLPVEQAVAVLRDVCDALSYAHERGIVHRDIKPANVLLSGRHALVSDFGIAKAVADQDARQALTATGVLLGTPRYMPPEQISGDAVDERADVYAVGVLAYELLTGRPPFSGENRQDIFAAHLTSRPDPLPASVPPALAATVMKCLEKLPADRWQSAAELARQLDAIPSRPLTASRPRWLVPAAAVAGVTLVAALLALWSRGPDPDTAWRNRWAAARIERLTDFPGDEVDAAISADGRYVAFLADRDSVFDAFVTQIGSGQFTNLTGGRRAQLFNEDVRNVGFTADASEVWIRSGDITAPATVSVIPTLGGTSRVFLNGAVMTSWSPDGGKLVFHQAIAGDPIFVADPDGSKARQIFIGNPGEHAHHNAWSPDGRFIYFSHGTPPNEMDIWRVPVAGGPAERLTHHNSRVGYPVLLDEETLLYVASDDLGAGPWLYSMNLSTRRPTRLSSGVEHYLSISASAEVSGEPRRLVATVSNPRTQLFSAAIGAAPVEESQIARLTLPLERAAAPRFARDSSLWYLASRGGGDGVWRLAGSEAQEVWKPSQGAVTGAAAISPHGQRACSPVQRAGRGTLHCWEADRTGVVTLAEGLDVRGAASWSPDGEWLAVSAADSTGVRVFKVPTNGGPPVRLVDSASFNPVWSPDGKFIVYSRAPRARSATMAAVTPDGDSVSFPSLTVDRLGDNYAFLPDSKHLVVKLGGFRRQDFWLLDTTTGERRQLTRLRPGESVNRFDVSPDGRRIVFERVRENSDVALIELPPR
jgi:Tol biopolymer transport system component